jgi:hypothetical protein
LSSDLKQVSARIPDDVCRAFKLKLVQNGDTMQDVLERRVMAYIGDKKKKTSPNMKEGHA